MRWPAIAVLVVACLAAHDSSGDETKQPGMPPFQGKLVLFGVRRAGMNAKDIEIVRMNPDGSELEPVATFADVGLLTGRIAPDGRRVAVGTVSLDGKAWETWIWEDGNRRKLPINAIARAWSPDGASLACYRDDQGNGWESLRVDVATGVAEALPIPHADRVDDWSPDGKLLSVIAGNREHKYERSKDNFYPQRQIDLLTIADGSRERITKEPLIDAIWSRFSPDGSLIAHEQRRHEPDKVLEYFVVRKQSGADPVEVVRCDKLDDELRDVPAYPSYPYRWYPHGAPCWSPDGSQITVCLEDGKWRSSHREPWDQWRWAMIIVTPSGKIVNRIDLQKLGIRSVGDIDWK